MNTPSDLLTLNLTQYLEYNMHTIKVRIVDTCAQKINTAVQLYSVLSYVHNYVHFMPVWFIKHLHI